MRAAPPVVAPVPIAEPEVEPEPEIEPNENAEPPRLDGGRRGMLIHGLRPMARLNVLQPNRPAQPPSVAREPFYNLGNLAENDRRPVRDELQPNEPVQPPQQLPLQQPQVPLQQLPRQVPRPRPVDAQSRPIRDQMEELLG